MFGYWKWISKLSYYVNRLSITTTNELLRSNRRFRRRCDSFVTVKGTVWHRVHVAQSILALQNFLKSQCLNLRSSIIINDFSFLYCFNIYFYVIQLNILAHIDCKIILVLNKAWFSSTHNGLNTVALLTLPEFVTIFFGKHLWLPSLSVILS